MTEAVRTPTTAASLRGRKGSVRPIVGLGVSDYPTALLADRARVDLILVGDSLGVSTLGLPRIEDTSMDDMLHHTRAVRRAVRNALLVGDLPAGTYGGSADEAVANARLLVTAGGAEAVKVEGGAEVAWVVAAMVAAGIPVAGHLTREHSGGERDGLVAAACDLERAGIDLLVLVGLAADTAAAITAATGVPTIGYRSGPHCDGQLLVTAPMLGLSHTDNFAPGPYGDLGRQMAAAFTRFRADVLGTGTED